MGPEAITYHTDEAGYQWARFSPEQWLRELKVPPTLIPASWESWDWRSTESLPGIARALRWLRDSWTRETGYWSVLLTAPPGRGKSHLAVAKLRQFLSWYPARECAYVRWSQLLRDIKETWDGYGSEATLLEAVESSRFLVLDDLGSEAAEADPDSPQWIVQRVFSMLEVRHAHGLPVVITTNLDRRRITARYGARLVSRLREGEIIDLSPLPDHRVGGFHV